MHLRFRPAVVAILFAFAATAQTAKPLLVRSPALSASQIAFECAGDIWIVSRDGGNARRLTNGAGRESGPHFSPDGTQIAFTGEYDGNIDVYVVAAAGGTPRRLTYHPGPDVAVGWTPDGKNILFNSNRDSYARFKKLYSIGLNGSFPELLPLPMGEEGSYSPDGSHLAYQPVGQYQVAWKKYMGGQTRKIWLADLKDSSITAIPRENSNDFNPMWIGNRICFLSDRNGAVSLFAWNVGSRNVTPLVKNDGLDIKSASTDGTSIVYDQFGSFFVLDLKSGNKRHVDLRIAGDFPEIRPHFEKLSVAKIGNAAISPTGQRAIFEAHGDLLTVPAEKGDIRNITNSPAVEDRDPAWSPDGKWIAYFSDESGEYALHIREQTGAGEAKKIPLGTPASFFYSPVWSPDSKKIAYFDKRLNLWYADVETSATVKVDTDLFDSPAFQLSPKWSPDSRWIAYAKQLHNYLHAVSVYSLADRKDTQITDGLSDTLFPDFDRNGKYLYFTSSTNVGLSAGWIDMSSIDRPVTRDVYVVVLKKDLPSPLAPESDDEKTTESKDNESKEPAKDATKPDAKPPEKVPDVQIDFEAIGQRILALPIPAKNYTNLTAGKEGNLYLQEAPIISQPGPPSLTIHRFDLKTRKTDKLLDGVTTFKLSANGEKMLFRQGQQWVMAASAAPPKPGDGVLKLADMEVYVNPREEWAQMYREVWRIERDFFYDPGFHGLDLKAAEKFYAAYLPGIATRADLNYLFEEMLGNINVGHMFIRGGSAPEIPHVRGGLLGADYKIENGRYRFTKIYNGENWNPQMHAPLTQPGVNVVAGEYLLAVRGRELRASDNIYSFFEETADKQIVLRVGPNPEGAGSRDVTVVPVENETNLRHLDWIEDNRRFVDKLSGGKIAYVHLPNTAEDGYQSFNRYFFAQVGRQGAVLDERFNGGGDIADYIIDYLNRRPMGRITSREGEDVTDPSQAIYGPKVMIINQFAGSGGDAMPWYFRKAALGPLVGMKTWGGLVGIGNYPPLMDGGAVTAPRWAFYGLTHEWEVENHGIAPDIEVDQDPKLVREGHDPQLEKAVEAALGLLKKNPPPIFTKPSYPNYHPVFPE